MMIQFEEKYTPALRELIFIIVPIGNIFSSACAVNNEHSQGAPFAVFALFDRSENAARGRDGGMAGLLDAPVFLTEPD